MDNGLWQIRADAATDIGLRRAVNEDAVLNAGTVFAVADGMGGHEAGDMASRLGIETLNELALRAAGSATEPRLPHAQDVLDTITLADARIREAIGARGGTTLCALVLVAVQDGGASWPAEGAETPVTAQLPVLGTPGEARYLDGTQESGSSEEAAADGGEAALPDTSTHHQPEPTTDVLPLAVAAAKYSIPPIGGTAEGARDAGATKGEVRLMLINVGDSRGYRLRDGVLTQLSRDHSAVQELIDAGVITEAEARIHPQRNLITRALGAGGNAVPETQFHTPRIGDRYLLCSDGLTGEIESDLIEGILAQTPERKAALSQLIDAALASGGRDNISALILDIEPSRA